MIMNQMYRYDWKNSLETYPSFRFDTLHLPLIHLSYLFTSPQLPAHVSVTYDHRSHRNNVRQKEQDDVVAEMKI